MMEQKVLWQCPNCGLQLNVKPSSVPFDCPCGKVVNHIPVSPSLLRKAANVTRDYAKHLLNSSRRVKDHIRQWRYEQCLSCDLFNHAQGICSHPQCGCGMKTKAGYFDALGWESKKCPIGRWDDPPGLKLSLDDITVVVSSFIRFECLRNLLKSLRFFYPTMPVVISDQSGPYASGEAYEFCRHFPNVTWLTQSYDSGISFNRNRAVEQVKTNAILLVDDDHVITDETKIEVLLEVLNETDVELVCGLIRSYNHVGNFGKTAAGWFADLEMKSNRELFAKRPVSPFEELPSGAKFKRTHRYVNCFLTYTDVLVSQPWYEPHKIAGEHIHHVIQLWHAGVQVAYTPNCIFGEFHENSELYNSLRKRNTADIARRRWKIKSETGLQRMEAEPMIPERETSLPMATRANIVILTLGHTGSTVVAGLLSSLGWKIPDCDLEYNEPIAIREANQRWIESKTPIQDDILDGIPQPWILKDPRFCETMEAWMGVFSKCRPTLLWIDRNLADVISSWRNRGEDLSLLTDRVLAVPAIYDYWPWSKQRIQIEDLAGFLKGFDPDRILKR